MGTRPPGAWRACLELGTELGAGRTVTAALPGDQTAGCVGEHHSAFLWHVRARFNSLVLDCKPAMRQSLGLHCKHSRQVLPALRASPLATRQTSRTRAGPHGLPRREAQSTSGLAGGAGRVRHIHSLDETRSSRAGLMGPWSHQH